MKHATPQALGRLAPLLGALRARPGLVERRPGVFYRRSAAFLHFHEDPAGLFADARVDGAGFTRFALGSAAQQATLLTAVDAALARTVIR